MKYFTRDHRLLRIEPASDEHVKVSNLHLALGQMPNGWDLLHCEVNRDDGSVSLVFAEPRTCELKEGKSD